MRFGYIITGLGLTAAMAACQTVPAGTTVADYCAMENNSAENVCQLNVEINGQKTALADTNMKLSEARSLASAAVTSADAAKASAARAQSTADQALSRANSALVSEADLNCETRTIRQSKIGTCQPGYSLMSCTQTRYTFRAGGMSFLREVNDQQCRFNSQVLEMQVRCCTTKTDAEASTIAFYSRQQR